MYHKTCFAGVMMVPQPIGPFPAENSFSIWRTKKKLSADQASITGVYQVFSPFLSFAEPVLQWNLIFVLRSKILRSLKRLFVVRIPRVTIYQENARHIRLTAFRWRCDEVEMRRTCLEAQKSMQANLVINSWKLYNHTEDTFTRHCTKGFSKIQRSEKVLL